MHRSDFWHGYIFGRRRGNVDRSPQDSANEATSDDSETVEETPAPDPEFDLDAFLAWVQKYADQAGIGSEYAKAVEAIKRPLPKSK
ncbi:MAG: hypothetical protein ACLRSW_05110 [Christensenellaceae bacterium]